MRKNDELDSTPNSTLHKRLYWRNLCLKNCYCNFCGPNNNENVKAWDKWHDKKKRRKFSRDSIRKPLT